jgi:repressor LexA
MQTLTSRQQEVLTQIQDHLLRNGVPPTRAELAQALGFRSANAAEEHLRALARKGAIELMPGASRGIRLLVASGLPVVGRVAAGSPILAEEHIEEHVALAAETFHPRAHYLLRVRGMSMREAGILDGDLLAVHQAPQAHNGQIVVARLEDEVTVKRFLRKGHMVELRPENADFESLHIDLREQPLHIEGIAVGVVRKHVA